MKIQKSIGLTIKYLAIIGFVVFGIWGFILDIGIVNEATGFWGVVIGVVVAPVTLVAAPWYAGVAWGNWFPLIITYGGVISSFILFSISSMITGDEG